MAARAGQTLAALLAALPLCASAGLFDDDEARRQIQVLRSEVAAGQAQLQSRIEQSQRAMDERLERLEAATRDRSAVVNLAQLIDELKQDMARLRGQIEVLANQSERLERRQKDLYADLDSRLKKSEQANAQMQEKLTQGEREAAAEKQTYEAALNQFKVGNYQLAISGFQNFLATFPTSSLAPSAQYWIGNAYYAMRDYRAAIAAQQKVLGTWPDNAKAPDAMLNIASSQLEMGDAKAARETLTVLVKRYPTSQAADQAKQRMTAAARR